MGSRQQADALPAILGAPYALADGDRAHPSILLSRCAHAGPPPLFLSFLTAKPRQTSRLVLYDRFSRPWGSPNNGQDGFARYRGILIVLYVRYLRVRGISIVLYDRYLRVWGISIVLYDRYLRVWGIPIVLYDR